MLGLFKAQNLVQKIAAPFEGHSLKAKVFRGSIWLGSGSVLEQASRFGRNLVLARLLAPDAFGTMIIVLSASSVLNSFTDIGVKEALIQNPRGTERSYIVAAWWLAMIRAVSLYIVLFFAAPALAAFYHDPRLVSLLRIATLSILFDGAFSPRAYVEVKQMAFRRWAAINHGGPILGVALTLFLSLALRNIWALVIGSCAESFFRCVLSYKFSPFIPSFDSSKKTFQELFKFSRGMFGLSFLNLIFARADIFVLGKLVSASELGIYAMAVSLVQAPVGFVMNLLGQTLLPTYSGVQDEDHRINRILLRTAGLVSWLAFPVLALVFFCGKTILSVAYGAQYATAGLPLVLASCVGLINLQNGQPTMIFYAKGMPQLHRNAVLMMALIAGAAMWPLSSAMGAAGAQIACLTSIVAGYSFQLIRLRRLTELSLFSYGKRVLLPAALTFGVFAFFGLVLELGRLGQPYARLLLGVAACLVCYSLGLPRILFSQKTRPAVLAGNGEGSHV
ncbi:MAG: oligosaccharide flippase family protein [Acidobacteriota bacterium]|nr:oligosaccharide flippase family protein [Acidobacteriota bacterium]